MLSQLMHLGQTFIEEIILSIIEKSQECTSYYIARTHSKEDTGQRWLIHRPALRIEHATLTRIRYDAKCLLIGSVASVSVDSDRITRFYADDIFIRIRGIKICEQIQISLDFFHVANSQ